MVNRGALITLATVIAACGGRDPQSALSAAGPAVDTTDQPPVALNPDLVIEYPQTLAERASGATVVLRLFADERGTLVADSTRIAESSGVAVMDSAAVTAVRQLRFAPALDAGRPVAAAFHQTIYLPAPPGPPANR